MNVQVFFFFKKGIKLTFIILTVCFELNFKMLFLVNYLHTRQQRVKISFPEVTQYTLYGRSHKTGILALALTSQMEN